MDTYLQKLLDEEINLSASHISQGSTSHTHIRDLLANKSQTDNKFPWLMEGDYLSGSYARGTKLHPLDDIDVMIVMDGAGLFPTDKGAALSTHYIRGNALGQRSPIHGHIGINGQLDSRVILSLFQKALAERFPGSVIKKNGQAVNVCFSSYGLGIDVVPCFHIVPHSTQDREMYYIPLGNGTADWLKTNPKTDEAISDLLHNKHDKRLKSIIKLLKYWNREKNAGRISSYHLETMAWHVFHAHPSKIGSLEEGIIYFFENARPHLVGPCEDLTGLGEPVDRNLSFEDRNKSVMNFDFAKLSITTRTVKGWRLVFGDKFAN